MDILTKTLTKIFGSKSERDIKQLTPYVDEINSIYSGLHDISNDELRQKAQDIRQEIHSHIERSEAEKKQLQEKAERDDVDVEEKEQLYKQIDDLEKSVDESLEEVLNELMPRAFAIMRETAKRFKENKEIDVTATATSSPSIIISFGLSMVPSTAIPLSSR